MDVAISGTPAGTPTIWLSNTPDAGPGGAVLTSAALVAPNTYRVAAQYPDLWYAWAQDANGFTDAPASAWVGMSDDPDLNLCGIRLQEILQANEQGLTLALRTWYPDATIKQIVYGSALSINDFPSLLITKPREVPSWAAFPWCRLHDYYFEIFLMLPHQDPVSQLPNVTNFMARVMELLNKPQYESIELASGLWLSMCQAQEGDSDESQIDEHTWSAVGSLRWTGQAMKQNVYMGPGTPQPG